MKKRKTLAFIVALILVVSVLTVSAFAADEEAVSGSNFYATFWALVPPIIAIVLALITKETYSSLFVGIVLGALFNSNFNIVGAWHTIVNDGFIASVGSTGNAGILIFLVILGAMVALINKAGGSKAFGDWAIKNVKSRTGAMLSTFVLGVLIFVDDYFNCLTVGSVMLPVTDSHKISRAKLSYIIDATAAPICMIAPISSWAAAVSGYVEGYNGLDLFIKAIPYNYYCLLTIVFIIVTSVMKLEYGPMAIHERNALEKGDLFTSGDRVEAAGDQKVSANGKVIDLVLPVIVLIVCCIVGIVYTGYQNGATTFISAFSDCDAALSLCLGSLIALIFTVFYMICRRLISFKDSMACITEGFHNMVSPILILVFAWTLCSMTGLLGADVYVESVMMGAADGLRNFLPAVIFIVACILSFSTGTSWGTFGILIPIVVAVFDGQGEILIIGISACLAGAVMGDHCSPISDTTIMASAGGQCFHLNHVSTQLPYALTVAAVSFVTFIIAGYVQNAIVCLLIGIVLMLVVLFVIKALQKNKKAA